MKPRSAKLIGAALVLGFTIIAVAFALSQRTETSVDSRVAIIDTPEQASAALTKAPPNAVRIMHNALHDIGRQCGLQVLGARGERRITRDVNVILTFVHQYPVGQFSIDDEVGTPLALLLAVRADVQLCSPSEADRINRALPIEYQS